MCRAPMRYGTTRFRSQRQQCTSGATRDNHHAGGDYMGGGSAWSQLHPLRSCIPCAAPLITFRHGPRHVCGFGHRYLALPMALPLAVAVKPARPAIGYTTGIEGGMENRVAIRSGLVYFSGEGVKFTCIECEVRARRRTRRSAENSSQGASCTSRARNAFRLGEAIGTCAWLSTHACMLRGTSASPAPATVLSSLLCHSAVRWAKKM